MKTLLTAAVIAAFAAPAFADEGQADGPRLQQLETLVVTAPKEEPASARLAELEIVVSTAPKKQPADYKVDDKTAALLKEIEKETK